MVIINNTNISNREYISLNEAFDYEIQKEIFDLQVFIMRENYEEFSIGKQILEEKVEIGDKVKNLAQKAGAKAKELGSKINVIIHKMIDFIVKITNKFIAKCRDLITRDSKWFEENVYKFANIPNKFWANASVTCFPYVYKAPNGNNADVFNKSIFAGTINVTKEDQIVNFLKTKIDDDNLRKKVSNKLYSINPDNFIDAAKIFYRGGRQEILEFKGNDCKEICDIFIDYVRNYKTTSRLIQNELNSIKGNLSRAETKYKTAQESFYFENRLFEKIVMEAETENKTTNGGFNFNNRGSANNTETGNTNTNNVNNNNNATSTNSDDNSKSGNVDTNKIFLDNLVRYNRLVLNVVTAKMTISEECYNCAMKTLRGVMNGYSGYKDTPKNNPPPKQEPDGVKYSDSQNNINK